MSVLGLDSGYTVKYNPLPSGKGLYLTLYPLSRPNTDTVYAQDNRPNCLLATLFVEQPRLHRVCHLH